MPQFSTGDNKEGFRSAKWNPSSYGFEGHVVRTSIGTSEAAEYCHAAADIPWGILANDGTQNNYVTIVTEGVINMRNSLNGTVALGDPIILDYTNSNGTTGFVRSGYASDVVGAVVNGGDVGTFVPARIPLSFKAVPGSVREVSNPYIVLHASGTVLLNVTAGASISGTFFYQIDQPVLGFAKEVASTPRQLFKVEIVKERFIKNNVVN